MRQLCPYCGKLVELPDEAAGREVPCPECAKPFAVPRSYVPTVVTAPPAGTPPAPASPPVVAAPATPAGENTSDEIGCTFSATLITWLPAAALTAALVLSLFFSWVGSYPGGFRAFTQSPIQALVASFTPNTFLTLQTPQNQIRDAIHSNWLMFPYLFSLAVAVVLAWLERVFPNPSITTVPAPLGWMVNYQPKRFVALIALTALCLGLIVLQSRRGFGLENAINVVAANVHAEELSKADTDSKQQEVKLKIGREVGSFCLDDTTASCLGELALVVALIALLLRRWLDRRGDQPLPRLILRC